MHSSDLVRNLAHHDGSREVAVIVSCPVGGKEGDDDRSAGPNRALTAEVRHRTLGGAGDDHVRAGEALLAEEKRRASIEALRSERTFIEPQDPVSDVRLG